MVKLNIADMENTVYAGEVEQIDVPGIEGSFQVLKNHISLMSVIKKGKLKVRKNNDEVVKIEVPDGGFIEVLKNEVKVLLW